MWKSETRIKTYNNQQGSETEMQPNHKYFNTHVEITYKMETNIQEMGIPKDNKFLLTLHFADDQLVVDQGRAGMYDKKI